MKILKPQSGQFTISLLIQKYKQKTISLLFWTLLLLSACLLSGCEGPSTAVLPGNANSALADGSELSLEVKDANPYFLQEMIERLSAVAEDPDETERSETDAEQYLRDFLTGCGYEISGQESAVEAVRFADDPEADIILLIANYGGTGAYDNASGAAALLETARLLAEFSTDTEIRFVFLSGGRRDLDPVRGYLENLQINDAGRLLGAVQIGPLGRNVARKNILSTSDGKPTFLAEQIDRICEAVYGEGIPCLAHEQTIQNVLLRNQIPTVVYQGSFQAAEQGTILDRPSLISYDFLADSVDVLSRTLASLMDTGTPSMQAKAHFYNDIRDDAYVQGMLAVLPFGGSVEMLETETGQQGTLNAVNTDNEGREILSYRYPMKWFGVDQIIDTDYYFTDGQLSSVMLRADSAGVEYEEAIERIHSVYGEYTGFSNSPSGIICEWLLPRERLRIELTPNRDGFDLVFTEYDTPRHSYAADILGASRLEELFKRFIPESAREHIRLNCYSDGYGKSKGYLERDEKDNNADEDSLEEKEAENYVLGLDLEDALNDESGWRDFYGSVDTLMRLYGEYLKDQKTEPYYQDFENRFGIAESSAADGSPMAADDWSAEEDWITGEGEAGKGEENFPDFVESFRLFVMAEKPEENLGEWGDRVRFFYEYEELTEYRSQVREGM
ncbi:MAG: M28 family peptidase [Clostridiales bacterium]|nr:M28 family peptidase [Clostridiales bacterium]